MSRTEQLADPRSTPPRSPGSSASGRPRSARATPSTSRRGYAPDAVTFGVAPPLSPFGGDARRVEWIRAWFERFHGRIDHRVHDLTVSVGDDLAFCRSLDVLSVRPVHGRREVVRFETVLGLRRVGGVWLVEAELLRVLPA